MALTPIKGNKVGLYVQKTDGSQTWTRVLCASSINIEVTTEVLETDCQDADGADGNFASSEPGQISWTASSDMTVRQATDDSTTTPPQTDATDNVTAENMLDYQLAGRKFQIRYQVGQGKGAAQYSGMVWITKNGFSSDNKTNAKNAVSFQGTGPLIKSLATV
jgi:hypothetical protein